MRHPSTFPLVNTLLGGKARFAQFDFRETPRNAGLQKMQFHHDHALPTRFSRPVYNPPDFICTIHYLCDVLGPECPAFSVVPRSMQVRTFPTDDFCPGYVISQSFCCMVSLKLCEFPARLAFTGL